MSLWMFSQKKTNRKFTRKADLSILQFIFEMIFLENRVIRFIIIKMKKKLKRKKIF